MAFLDWIFVIFGIAVALTGSWIQLHPQHIYPRQAREQGWQLDPSSLTQIRILGACFLFMGTFFALQMTIDLARLPWWTGTLGGLITAIAAVALVNARVRRQSRRRAVLQSALPKKVLELRY